MALLVFRNLHLSMAYLSPVVPHEIPKELLKQLCVGGRMVIPVGEVTQKMIVIDRVTEEEFKVTEHGEFKFVPMLTGTEK